MSKYDFGSSNNEATKYDFGNGGNSTVPTTFESPGPFNLAGLPYVAGHGATTPVGIAYNTVVGIPEAAGKVAKSIGQGLAQDFFGVGLSIGNVVNKILGRDITTSYTPTNSFSKSILGETTNDIATRVVNAEQAIKDSPLAQKLGLDKVSGPLAFGGVIGSVGLDFTGLGGEEAAGKQLLKEITESGAFKILTKSKVPEEVAKRFAPEFAKASTLGDVNQLMNLMKGEIGKNSLEKGITMAAEKSNPEELATGQSQLTQASPLEKSTGSYLDTTINNKYVKDEPLTAFVNQTDKKTAQGLRDEFVGIKNEQIVKGNQLADAIKLAVPKKAEREGMFWYKAANGDPAVLEAALKDPKLADYHPQIESALKLSPKAVEALDKVSQFYKESGQVSLKNDTIKGITENYQNRLYGATPPKDFVKTELASGLKTSTSHTMSRVFNTEFEAAQAGKKFATTDIADSLSIYNEEMARVNASRKLFDAMDKNGIGAWSDREVPGWSQVGTLKKGAQRFIAPNGIAKGLRAISEPNFLSKIDALRGIQKYQGLVKTVDLAFSFFHHFTFAVQTLSQGGITTLIKSPVMEKILKSPEFAELEQDFAKHTGITTKVSSNQDILKKLSDGDKGVYGKVTNLPVVKQTLHTAEKFGSFLFDHIQRYLKVSDYGGKISNWVASHPTATNEEVIAAKKGFAKEINAAYGGLNWETMGITKSELNGLRFLLLAPDFTLANASLVKYAFQTGTVGSAARKNLVLGTLAMMTLTEGANKILTGHYTDQNPTGHKMEIEISPGVYISLLRGAQGEVNKFISNLIQSGPIKGPAQYFQGKLSPLVRTGVGLASGVNYYGQAISSPKGGPVKNTVDYAKYIAQNAGPVPFGVSNTLANLKGGKTTPAGVAAMVSGLGRYAPGKQTKVKYRF